MPPWARVAGAVRGVIGDRLHAVDLAPAMTFVDGGAPVRTPPPGAGGHAVVLLHGLAGTEADWGTVGDDLARDLGVVPLHVRYNSGRAIADSGLSLAGLLDDTLRGFDEVTLLGHSLGGLVIRAACATAALRGDAWLARTRRAIYVGTPHRGAPLERAGQAVVQALGFIPTPAPLIIAAVASRRSAAVQDLGRHRQPAPLRAGLAHHFVAGAVHTAPWVGRLVGDGLVPIVSATDGRDVDDVDVVLVAGVGHATLPRDPRVYARVRGWLTAGGASPGPR